MDFDNELEVGGGNESHDSTITPSFSPLQSQHHSPSSPDSNFVKGDGTCASRSEARNQNDGFVKPTGVPVVLRRKKKVILIFLYVTHEWSGACLWIIRMSLIGWPS